MNLTLIGLGVIVLAWLVQFICVIQKKNKINTYFVFIYIIGVAVLVYDGFASELTSLAIANLVSLVVAGLVLIAILVKK
jgi:hypothetical protein